MTILLKNHFIYISCAVLGLIFSGCQSPEHILYSAEDLSGSHIAVLNHSVSDDDFETMFPTSDMMHFKSSSEFLLALSIGKCDAGIVNSEDGMEILDRSEDYDTLSSYRFQTDTALIIAHRSLLPGRNVTANANDVLDESIDRIYRSILSDGYWILILKGFYATASIFILGVILAFSLACLMLIMNRSRYLKYISKPLSYFIKTIHDVPSIVLIFFFYYIVFASTHISGILVCALSLGVYTSGSLMNIFNVHLNQIDRTQHAAAQMLGLTGWKKYRFVILPQAAKPMLPLIASEFKVLLRATTYAGYISELDLVKVTEIIRNETYDVLVPLLLVSLIFLIMSHIIVEGVAAVYNKAFKYD